MTTRSVQSSFGYLPQYEQLNKLGQPVTFNALTIVQYNLANDPWNLTPNIVLGGFVQHVSAGGVLDTPSAADLVAAMPGCVVGTGFYFLIKANSAGASVLTANTGVTISGTAATAPGNSKTWLVVVTSNRIGAEAITMYSLGENSFT